MNIFWSGFKIKEFPWKNYLFKNFCLWHWFLLRSFCKQKTETENPIGILGWGDIVFFKTKIKITTFPINVWLENKNFDMQFILATVGDYELGIPKFKSN